MRTLRLVAAAMAAAVPALAQQTNVTAHPQTSLLAGGGNFSPFGVFSTGAGAEARTQILVPADELPGTGALLVGIELNALVGGTVDYASLTIEASPTTASSLSMTFASNVVAPPTTVLQATSLSVVHSTTAWVPIAFRTPYVHDGFSALLLDIQKIVQAPSSSFPFVTTSKNASPPRVDRPQMVYTFGGPGSGQSTATTATSNDEPISFRLVWQNTPTLYNRSDANATGTQYALGSSVDFTLRGDPNALWALGIGTGFLPGGVVIPGFLGTFRLANALVLSAGLCDANGTGTTALTIPNQPSAVGFYLTYQGASIDPTTATIWLTNGTDHFVNP